VAVSNDAGGSRVGRQVVVAVYGNEPTAEQSPAVARQVCGVQVNEVAVRVRNRTGTSRQVVGIEPEPIQANPRGSNHGGVSNPTSICVRSVYEVRVREMLLRTKKCYVC